VKIKFVLLFATTILFFGIYGWRCSSSKKTHRQDPHSSQSTGVSSTDSSSSEKISPEVSPAVSSRASSPASKNSNAAPAINISTTHPVPLYKDIHAGVAVDIFFAKGMVPRDILSDPYFSFIKSFNFTSLQYVGGSTTDHDHVIIGDTRITGGKGDGYNVNQADVRARGEDFNTLDAGADKVHFGKDFFNEYCALLNKLGITGDIVANVQVGTLDELYWKIDQSHARRVMFGQEQDLVSNEHVFPNGNSYKQKVTPWIEQVKKKYPSIQTVIDAAPVYRPNERFSSWNNALKDMPGDEVRVYLWDIDALKWQPDANQNLAAMDEVFNVTFPGWFTRIRKVYPDKKIAVCQWGIKAKSEVANSMLACIYIGKFYKFMIDYNKAHNNYISYASWMTIKSLNRNGETANHALPLRACGKLFYGNKRVLDLDVNGINGVSGVACDDPDASGGKYTLLLINETGNEVSLSNITVNDAPVQGKKFTVTSVNAASLSSMSVSMDTKTYSSLSLHPYSVNVVEF